MSTAPVMQGQVRVSDPRRLLVDRVGVVLGRMFRSLRGGFARWRRQAKKNRAAANGGGLGLLMGAVMGRALAAKGARGRMLAVEERLALGPKQHMYLVRCGEQRLLVASAGESALQWMMLPEEPGQEEAGQEEAGRGEAEACGNTLPRKTKPVARSKRRAAETKSGTKRVSRKAVSEPEAERAR